MFELSVVNLHMFFSYTKSKSEACRCLPFLLMWIRQIVRCVILYDVYFNYRMVCLLRKPSVTLIYVSLLTVLFIVSTCGPNDLNAGISPGSQQINFSHKKIILKKCLYLHSLKNAPPLPIRCNETVNSKTPRIDEENAIHHVC